MVVLKKNSPLHPPYLQMVSEAITTMKDRTGSSQPAIAKFIEENYSKLLPQNFKKILSIQLKRFLKSEKLIKFRNSYKIPAADKPKQSSNSVQKKASTILKNKPANRGAEKNSDAKMVVAVKTTKKTKRLSQVKTPEKMKKNKAVTPVKRKVGPKSTKTGSRPPAKKAKN